ncbi:MAG: hypothetical protein WCK91_03365 [bacterium]
MDIQELDKKQLILLTLLITFVVSIATGIITVSLVNQAPKSVPQTVNNIIQRTIEKVTTVPAPTVVDTTPAASTPVDTTVLSSGDEVLIPIYSADGTAPSPASSTDTKLDTKPVSDSSGVTAGQEASAAGSGGAGAVQVPDPTKPKSLGSGVIISDIGLVLVDTEILTDKDLYKVILNGTDFDATVLKRFTNGFTILKISVKKPSDKTKTPPAKTVDTPPVDNKQ